MGRLQDRLAIVTGAANGLGAAIARRLGGEGARLALLDIDAVGLERVAADLRGQDVEAFCQTGDVTEEAVVQTAFARIAEECGPADVLVNNVGGSRNARIWEMSAEDWDLVQAVNLRAPFLLAQALAPGMIERRMGKVINVSSQTSDIALVLHGAYAASKNGLNALTKVMTAEWAPFNVQSNAVCPTVILTPMGEKVWGDPARGDPMRDD